MLGILHRLGPVTPSARLRSPKAAAISPSIVPLAHALPILLHRTSKQGIDRAGRAPIQKKTVLRKPDRPHQSHFSSAVHPRLLCCIFKPPQSAYESGRDGEAEALCNGGENDSPYLTAGLRKQRKCGWAGCQLCVCTSHPALDTSCNSDTQSPHPKASGH